jgi:hypothetical protein
MISKNTLINFTHSKCVPKKYTIFGERHSGTKLLEKSISINFKLDLTWEYGSKHFFGFSDIKSLANSCETIFICVIRNPYTWILANNKQPHHIPGIRQNLIYLKEWSSVYVNNTEILEDRCYWDQNKYKDIYELRYWKNIYLLYILPIVAHNTIFFRYEDFISDQLYYLNFIQELYSIPFRPRVNRLMNIEPPKHYSISQNDLEYINDNIHWNIENICGYEKQETYP